MFPSHEHHQRFKRYYKNCLHPDCVALRCLTDNCFYSCYILAIVHTERDSVPRNVLDPCGLINIVLRSESKATKWVLLKHAEKQSLVCTVAYFQWTFPTVVITLKYKLNNKLVYRIWNFLPFGLT